MIWLVLLVVVVLNLYAFLAVEVGTTSSWPGWVCWVTVQFIMGMFTVLGWFLLLPFCIARAWYLSPIVQGSLKDGRQIDRWSWGLLNKVYGNPEDGVSGRFALIWRNGVQVPYMPNAPAWWRAYCWSAWRNSCDSLKYRFAWWKGPQATVFGHKIGWWEENGYKVPVL